MRKRWWSLWAMVLLSGVCVLSVSAATNEAAAVTADMEGHEEMPGADTRKPYTIAVVRDGACRYFDGLAEQVKHELDVLAGDEYHIRFLEGPQFSAQWKAGQVGEVLRAALADESVDLVYANGYLVARAASQADFPLARPVISGFPQDPETLGLPYDKEGHSTKTNFTFVVVPLRTSRDLEVLHEITPFKNLAIIVDQFLVDNSKREIEDIHRMLDDQFESSVEIVGVGTKAEAVRSGMSDKADAVYLTPVLRMTSNQWQQVINICNEKKLPSVSMLGYQDVEEGVLAGLAPPMQERMARRIALNIQQIMMGAKPEELQVRMSVDEKLVVNAKTARDIDFDVPFDVLCKAEILNAAVLEDGDPLNYEQTIAMALEHNVDLAIQDAETEGSRQDMKKAMSLLLPQVDGSIQYSQVDRDTARASMGSQAEKQTVAGVSASQVLFNDPILAQYRASRRTYEGSEDTKEAVRLDVTQSAALSYVQFLQARALRRIEQDNLRLTLSNLDLARVRHQVGTAGPEEVYRWEAQASSQRAKVLEANAAVDNARVVLNRVMGINQDRQWKPQDITLKQAERFFLDKRLDSLLVNQGQMDLATDFVVDMALRNSPTLKSLDASIEAQRIQLSQLKRRFIAPEIAARFDYDYTLDDDYVDDPFEEPPDDTWMVAIQASLPLFEGGGRVFDVRTASAALRQLEQTRRQTREYIEQQGRNIMVTLASSYPNMQLQQEAANYSDQNLSVIKDKYARGVVSILDLLDAQNQAFVARQQAAIAVYSYLEDIIDMQRIVSWFEVHKDDTERDALVDAMRAYLKTHRKSTGGAQP